MNRKTLIACTALSTLLGMPAAAIAAQETGAMQSQTQTQAQGGLMHMQVKQITGKSVVNNQGEKLGKVKHVVQNISDDNIETVVSVGGFLGIGDKEITIPADQLQPQGDRLVWEMSISKDQLKQQAEYEESQYRGISEDRILADVSSGMEASELQASFNSLDADQDGYITAQEAQSDEQLSSNFQQADKNADNQIDESEFSAFEVERPELMEEESEDE